MKIVIEEKDSWLLDVRFISQKIVSTISSHIMNQFEEIEKKDGNKIFLDQETLKILFSANSRDACISVSHDDSNNAAFEIRSNKIMGVQIHEGTHFFATIPGHQVINLNKILGVKMVFSNIFLQKNENRIDFVAENDLV